MPGFETSRFVGLTEFHTTNMSCGICLGIMRQPVETHCGHTYCKSCIDEWMKTTKSCPECRKQLGTKRKRGSDVVYYSETSKKYNQMFDALDIMCEFEGCHRIIKLENIEKHTEECDFNKCNVCGLRMGKKSEHNCVQLLKNVWYNSEKANQTLVKTLTEERVKISEILKQLRVENEKYKQLEVEMKTGIFQKSLSELHLNIRLKSTDKRLAEKTELISIKDLEIEQLITDIKNLKKVNSILKVENIDSKQLTVQFINGFQLKTNQSQNESGRRITFK